ncbi:MAG: hypothetical protein B7X02_00825 [Rhodospirillales bacterium 12-54-5]|nr:MAG: hypothetical protein B7X02_00825 [Rhodospirillales bacterium 12-54-5]
MPMTPPRSSEMSAPVLTQLDVNRLLADPSAESRMHVLARVANHYNQQEFGAREYEVAEQIFRLLMKDVVLAVRESLAQHIRQNSRIPRDIILHAAHDVESVAVPVLTDSPVFSDADLVAIIEANKDLTKLLAITRREHVSSRVSDALVEVNHPDVVDSLVHNDGAEISEHAYGKIVDEFHGDKDVMQSLANRAKLPMMIIERLVHEASAAIAIQLKKKYKLTDAQLKTDATEAHDDTLLYLLSNRVTDSEMLALVEQMKQDHRLNSTLIMKGLCRGQLAFFAASLACLAGISMTNATLLLNDKGGLGFRGLYAKAGLPESMVNAAFLVFQSAQSLSHVEVVPGSRIYANRLAEVVLQEVGNDNILHMPYFIALIRQPIRPH